MGKAMKELLFQYNWKRVGLLYRPGSYSLAVTEGILNEVLVLVQPASSPQSHALTTPNGSQATLAGVDFVSITLPVALTNETIDTALQQLEVLFCSLVVMCNIIQSITTLSWET